MNHECKSFPLKLVHNHVSLDSCCFIVSFSENTSRLSSRFLPAQSPIITRAQGSHTKPGKDYDDSFAACTPLCLCPHTSEMKGGGNYLGGLMLRVHWLEPGGAGLVPYRCCLLFCVMINKVQVKMSEKTGSGHLFNKVTHLKRQHLLAQRAALYTSANNLWNNLECCKC